MPGAAVQTTFPGLSREIAAIAGAVPSDLKPLLRAFGTYLGGVAKSHFTQQAASDGTPWAPLKRPRARKRDKSRNKLPSGKAQGGQKILSDSNKLMASFTGQAVGSVLRITETTVEQGSNLDYAGFHQEGTRHMVARPPAGVNEQNADVMQRMAADWFGGRR